MIGVFFLGFCVWLGGVNVLLYLGMRKAYQQKKDEEGYDLPFWHFHNWDHDGGGELAFKPIERYRRYLPLAPGGLRTFHSWSFVMIIMSAVATIIIVWLYG